MTAEKERIMMQLAQVAADDLKKKGFDFGDMSSEVLEKRISEEGEEEKFKQMLLAGLKVRRDSVDKDDVKKKEEEWMNHSQESKH